MCCQNRVSCLSEYPAARDCNCPVSTHQRKLGIRRSTREISTSRGIRARIETYSRMSIGATAGTGRTRVCCLWGMLLSLHTAMREFRNRYRGVGHGRMQPAVAVQRPAQHAYEVANRVLWLWSAAVYCKPTRTVQREAYVPGLASDTEPWHWSGSPASENQKQNTAGEVRRRAMSCARLRTPTFVSCFRQESQKQPVRRGHDVEDAPVGVPPKRELPQSKCP